MTGIEIPRDRTIKQPVLGCCYNPECLEDRRKGRFEFQSEHDHFACPKCGADRAPLVYMLVLIHLLVPQKGGKIVGKGGIEYNLACDETRAYLATVTNQEAATGDPTAANCPGCLAAAAKMRIVPKAVNPAA